MPQFVLTVQPDNKAEHLADYSSSLASLSRTVDFEDVTFHFGHGAKIRTNKLLLARASQLFGQVFEVNCNACAPVNYDVICPDVCDQVSWVTWNRTSIQSGYMYCCTVASLRAAVSYAPDLGDLPLLI